MAELLHRLSVRHTPWHELNSSHPLHLPQQIALIGFKSILLILKVGVNPSKLLISSKHANLPQAFLCVFLRA